MKANPGLPHAVYHAPQDELWMTIPSGTNTWVTMVVRMDTGGSWLMR